MSTLRDRRVYFETYRDALDAHGAYRPSAHILPASREWYESGVPAEQAAQWTILGYRPGAAAPLIADGVTPDMAAEMGRLDADCAGSPEQQAMQRIDELVRDGVLIDPAQVRWHEDPHDPMHIIVDVQVPQQRPAAPDGHWTVVTLVHGEQLYADLLARIRQDDTLVAAMWADAESHPDELDVPHTYWTVALLDDGTPAAWCAAHVQDDGVIKCHSNYEARPHRGRGLYEAAYRGRHQDVVRGFRRDAITYLFAQPVALHERDGWGRTGVTGVSEAGHRWWELRRPQ